MFEFMNKLTFCFKMNCIGPAINCLNQFIWKHKLFQLTIIRFKKSAGFQESAVFKL